MKRRPKLMIFLILVVFIAVACIGYILISHMMRDRAAERILNAVELQDRTELRLSFYENWIDPLKYKDGYEILILSNGNNVDVVNGRIQPKPADEQTPWLPPDTWIVESVSISELSDRLHVTVDTEAVWKASMGGDHCDAWYFLNRRGKDIPFEEREFFLCYYDAQRDNVYIYRGHDLYGI